MPFWVIQSHRFRYKSKARLRLSGRIVNRPTIKLSYVVSRAIPSYCGVLVELSFLTGGASP